ncbi:uncharacterized protein LOC143862545 [Tasmannia lanceolata]|uniref:uncharacterized protein LOC143862545 n=1 Tax=Tasmannia lanceolata TaxID=3420 RepID=UPI0040632405
MPGTGMENKRSKSAVLKWVLLLGLVSQNLVIPVMCRSLEGFEDQKNYYPTDPHTTPKSPPRSHSHGTPSHGGSHGTPSHGGGGSYGTPSHGGGSYGTPSPGGGSGGGYSYSPPTEPSTPAIITPPSIITPPIITPPIITPPTLDPGTPYTPTPTVPDPNTPMPFLPGTCYYWNTHPQLIWGIFGFWGTIAGVFGAACTQAFGHNLSLQEALANTRKDGIGALYREGAASLLNSMVIKNFAFTTQQVKHKFTAAIVSDKAAGAQAQLFKLANEGKLNRRK